MVKKTNKINVLKFFKNEILATRIAVDNLRKENWKGTIAITSLREQKKFKLVPKK